MFETWKTTFTKIKFLAIDSFYHIVFLNMKYRSDYHQFLAYSSYNVVIKIERKCEKNITYLFDRTRMPHFFVFIFDYTMLNRLMPGSQFFFIGQPSISVGQPILVQPKYNPT